VGGDTVERRVLGEVANQQVSPAAGESLSTDVLGGEPLGELLVEHTDGWPEQPTGGRSIALNPPAREGWHRLTMTKLSIPITKLNIW
jgi:hypothetical protein